VARIQISAALEKDPDEKLDYSIDWSDWLGGDTIASSDWTVERGDVTLSGKTNSTTGATVWVDAGTAGKVNHVVNSIVTAAGREAQAALDITVRAV
jgi:hypothetical protein